MYVLWIDNLLCESYGNILGLYMCDKYNIQLNFNTKGNGPEWENFTIGI